MHMLSTMRSLSAATSRATRSQSPSENFMMFALCTAVIWRRPLRLAQSNANSKIRRVPVTEIGLIEMPASRQRSRPPFDSIQPSSSSASCVPSSYSMPAYRSSVFSRFDDVDLVIVRENTEDLYAGIEYEEGT